MLTPERSPRFDKPAKMFPKSNYSIVQEYRHMVIKWSPQKYRYVVAWTPQEPVWLYSGPEYYVTVLADYCIISRSEKTRRKKDILPAKPIFLSTS